MWSIYFLVKKNLKLLIRSKTSALIVILSPLLIILLIGLSYNTSQTGLNIGVYAPSFTKDINSFVTSLQEENYKIIKYDDSKDCVSDIKLGFVHTCLVLPQDFEIKDNKQKEITFYVDQTKINLVYMITNVLNKKFDLKAGELSKGIVSGIMTKLDRTQTKLKAESAKVAAAKDKNSAVANKSDSLKSSLNAIDFTPPKGTYDIAVIDTFKTTTATSATDAITKLESVELSINLSSLNSSDKAFLGGKIGDARAKVDTILNLIEGNGTGNLKEVMAAVTAMQTDLTRAKNKLEAASKKVTASRSDFKSISTDLEASVAALTAIKNTLDEIKEDLSSQKVTSASTITSPITTKIEKIAVEETHLGYMFPSLMVLVSMFVSILLGTTLVMMEKYSPAHFRNFVVPVKKITFVFATYFTNMLVILVQIAIILSISFIFLGDILAKLPLTALILVISSSVFTLIGILVGYVFTSEDTGTLASISVGSLFLFISGVVLPLESMSASVRKVIYFNPFVIGEKLIREVFIFDSTFSVILNDLLLLVGYAVILFILILIVDSLLSKHFVTRMTYKHHKYLREKKKKIKKKSKK